jgi:hypothetical protein
MPRLLRWSAIPLAAAVLAGCGSSKSSSTSGATGFNDPRVLAKSLEEGGPERKQARLAKVTCLPTGAYVFTCTGQVPKHPGASATLTVTVSTDGKKWVSS